MFYTRKANPKTFYRSLAFQWNIVDDAEEHEDDNLFWHEFNTAVPFRFSPIRLNWPGRLCRPFDSIIIIHSFRSLNCGFATQQRHDTKQKPIFRYQRKVSETTKSSTKHEGDEKSVTNECKMCVAVSDRFQTCRHKVYWQKADCMMSDTIDVVNFFSISVFVPNVMIDVLYPHVQLLLDEIIPTYRFDTAEKNYFNFLIFDHNDSSPFVSVDSMCVARKHLCRRHPTPKAMSSVIRNNRCIATGTNNVCYCSGQFSNIYFTHSLEWSHQITDNESVRRWDENIRTTQGRSMSNGQPGHSVCHNRAYLC